MDRPINHLYPLEVPSEENEEGEEMNRDKDIVSCALVGDEGVLHKSLRKGTIPLGKGEFFRKIERRETPSSDVTSAFVYFWIT